MHKKKLPRFLMWVNILRKLATIRNRHNVIGIFSMWCHECAFIGKHAAKLFALKHYCWLLGQDARKTNAAYIKKIKPLATELVASSDFLQQEFYRNYHIKPAHVIPHGVDISLFDPNFFIRDIDIIGVGGLSIIKQYDQFVEIVAELKNHFPSIKAMLCGDGEDKDRLQKMIEEKSLQNNITITGMLQHSAVLKLMQRSKILLHPSSYEGFGIVCIEALYAGAHVISFCDPTERPIEHWHIVTNLEEMYKKVLYILNDTNTDHTSVLVNDMATSAKKLMQLYNVAL